MEDVFEIYNSKCKFLGTILTDEDKVLIIYYFDVDNMILKDKTKCKGEDLIEYSEEIRVGDAIDEFIHSTFDKTMYYIN
ncbi:hypothetical protein [Terrisporobacter glycolicus]|uniref:hypothetical protein n=1 Tax=Terrisporobacter glycolicus TaxID=36841 RepID=UPI000CDF1159